MYFELKYNFTKLVKDLNIVEYAYLKGSISFQYWIYTLFTIYYIDNIKIFLFHFERFWGVLILAEVLLINIIKKSFNP